MVTFSRRTFLKGLAAGACLLRLDRRVAAQTPLRLSLPPLQDVLPLGFAHNEGMFVAAGLEVELVGISSHRERSSALLSNNLDGVVSDVSSLLFSRGNAEADIVATSTAFEVIDDTRQVALLASGFFNISDLDSLLKRINDRAANKITVSRRTDFELITDELLTSLNIKLDPDLYYADTDDLINAATLLVGGSVLSAVLPEPLAALTERNELIEEQFLSKAVSNFENTPLPPSVVVFRREVIEARQADLELFYQVYGQAIDLINEASKDSVRESAILNTLELFLPGLSRSELPQDFGKDYKIPTFPQPRALREEEFDRVLTWTQQKGYLQGQVDFDVSVDVRFIPPA